MLSQKENVRNYEKVNNNYNMLEQNDQVQRLQIATDTLAKQVDVLTASNNSLKSKTQILKWAFSGVTALLVWLLFFKRKRNA